MIVVGRMAKFKFEVVSGPLNAPIIEFQAEEMVGYLPVYPDRETAQKYYPEGPFFEIREVEEALK